MGGSMIQSTIPDPFGIILEFFARILDFSAMMLRRLSCKILLRGTGRVRVYRQLHQPPMPPHRHEFFEIVIVLSGSGVHVAGSFRHRVEAGDVLVINSRRAHGYAETSHLNLVNILVREDVIFRIGRELRGLPGYHSLFNATVRRWRNPDISSRLRLSSEELGRMEEWIARLEEESSCDAPGSSFIAEAYLTLIIAVLVRHKPGKTGGPPTIFPAIARLLGWLDKNCHRPLKVADLARQAGMSERTLHREFRRAMELSPSNYLVRCRIERAAEHLCEDPGTRRIGEIAGACGFEDSNYFSTCFRRLKGCSPREYRNRKIPQ